jgi:hypothetical protein
LNFAPGEDFAPSARRYVLRYIEHIPENFELPANFRVLYGAARSPARPMMDKTSTPPDIDPELAEKIARYKRRAETRVADIKRDLAQWIADTTSLADYGEVSTALLELAFERKLAIDDDAADVFDLVQRAFQRVVRQRKGPSRDLGDDDDRDRTSRVGCRLGIHGWNG